MSDGLFWAAKLAEGRMVFFRGPVSVTGAAYYHDKPDMLKYLVLDDSGVHEVNQEAKDAIDAAEAQEIAEAQAIAETEAQVHAEADEAAEQARVQERLDSFVPLIPTARAFRTILRAYFGAGAETDRNITSEMVMGYFLKKRETGLTTEETFDAVALMKMHQVLIEWNQSTETWTIPWELVAEE
jgi:hypothetical protein